VRAVWHAGSPRVRFGGARCAVPPQFPGATAHAHRGRVTQCGGGVLDALLHPIQIVIRSTPATSLPVLERVTRHGSRQAADLAGWFRAHLHGAEFVQRERYLVLPAELLEHVSIL